MNSKFFYSIFDARAKMYMDPFVAVRDEVAMRDFQRNCSQVGSPLYEFPEDYSLVRLGDFDMVSGYVGSQDGPVTICRASAFAKKDNGNA